MIISLLFLPSLLTAGGFSNFSTNKNKTLFYSHCDDTGSTTMDFSTHNYKAGWNGTGTASVTGVLGQAVSLNGNGELRFPYTTDWIVSDFTMMAFIRLAPSQGILAARGQIFGQSQGGCCNFTFNLYGPGFADANGQYRLESNISFDANSQLFSTVITTGIWVHVAWRRINCQETSIFFDGRKVGSVVADCAQLTAVNAANLVTFFSNANINRVAADVDEINIKNTALSDGEIWYAAHSRSRPHALAQSY